jgi:VWFA-related protein
MQAQLPAIIRFTIDEDCYRSEAPMARLPSVGIMGWLALIYCLYIPGVAHAQTLSSTGHPSSTPNFTATTDLVLVPVVVRQGKQRVSGLTKNDFTIYEDKVPQRIAFVKPTTTVPGLRRGGGDNVFTNELESHGEAPRLTIIAVDTINTPFVHQSWVSHEVLKFLGNNPVVNEPTSLMAITPKGLLLIHDFTTDTAALTAAFERASGKKPHKAPESRATEASPPASQEKSGAVLGTLSWVETDSPQDVSRLVERLTRSLEALTMMAQSLSGIPGRKTLIWFTGAFPFSELDDPGAYLLPKLTTYAKGTPKVKGSTAANSPNSATNVYAPDSVATAYKANQSFANESQLLRNDDLQILRPLYERTMKLLADANVAVYPADARGMVVTFPGADVPNLDEHAQIKNGSLDTGADAAMLDALGHISMRNFAEMTGGSPCYSVNDLGSCLHNAVSDSESYYLLGYYRDKKNNQLGWRTLKVNVNLPGAQVMARNGYFYLNEALATDEVRRRDISYALISPIDFSGIPFTVEVKQTASAAAKLHTVDFQLQIPPSSLMDDPSGKHHMSLEVVASAATPKGQLVDKFSKTVEGTPKPQTAESILKHGVSYSDSLHVPAGDFTLRFVVRDNLNGRIGSVVVPFAVK